MCTKEKKAEYVWRRKDKVKHIRVKITNAHGPAVATRVASTRDKEEQLPSKEGDGRKALAFLVADRTPTKHSETNNVQK